MWGRAPLKRRSVGRHSNSVKSGLSRSSQLLTNLQHGALVTSDFSGMGSEMEILKQLDIALEIAGASEVFLSITGAESFYQVKRQIQGIGGIVAIDPLSKFNG